MPTIYKIVECEEQKIIDDKLAEMSYVKIDLTSVQIYENIVQTKYKQELINIDADFNETCKNCFYQCNNIQNKEEICTIEEILKNIRHDIVSACIMEGNTFVGCGYSVIEKGFAGLFDIVVKEGFRGKGYGKEIVETILAKSKEFGINKAYLLVVNNNTVAKKLYEKIGFREMYKYWYRQKD